MGAHFLPLLFNSGSNPRIARVLGREATPLPRQVFAGPAELPLCTALIVEEVSPAFRHRLKIFYSQLTGGTNDHGVLSIQVEVTVIFATRR